MLLSLLLMILACLVFRYSVGSVFFYFHDYCVALKIPHYLCIFYAGKPRYIPHGCDLLLSEVIVSKTSIYFKFNVFYSRDCLIATGNLFSKNHPHTMHFRDTMHFSLIGMIFYILDVPSNSPVNRFNEKVIASDRKDLYNSVFATRPSLWKMRKVGESCHLLSCYPGYCQHSHCCLLLNSTEILILVYSF